MGCGTSHEQPFSNNGTSANRPQKKPQADDDRLEIVSVAAEVDKETLERYIELEREIQEREAKAPLKQLELKSYQITQVEQQIPKLETELMELRAQTNKEDDDDEDAVNAVQKEILKNAGESGLDEQAEASMAAINRQSTIQSELKRLRDQKENLQKEIDDLNQEAEELQDLYTQQDDVLDRIFGGQYGSAMENKLEQELEDLEDNRGRILEANFKWRQAQMMLEYACKQMAVAITKWQELKGMPTEDLEARYAVATEARNNLVAASQNMDGAQRHLENVTFPYCTPDEVNTLKQAASYVFADMQTEERHAHAEQCYVTTHQRAAALLQWFDQVLSTQILKDLNEVNEGVKDKTLNLRRERINLIKAKVEEMWGKPLDVDLEAGLLNGVEVGAVAEPKLNKAEVARLDSAVPDIDRSALPTVEGELAPMPSRDELFGKSEAITQQHKMELEKYKAEQEQSQMRMNESLQEKLAARRQRRAKMRVEQHEKTAFAAG